ncbi:hypothetical protein HZH68_012272 [Vespula germanica]|uniref:Uncharacterized protein n=1 Tax=Vespula germanica TaxID=30212 RepID=A0A834JHV0_VESGE|nr:hypothetical protein HZH68_012272 [Vespula germanica]
MRSCEISRLTTIANIEVEENAEEDEEMAVREERRRREEGGGDSGGGGGDAAASNLFVAELSQVYFFGIQFSATPFSLADFLMLSRRKRIKSAREGTHEKDEDETGVLGTYNFRRQTRPKRGGRQWESGKVGKWVETTSSIGPKEIRKSSTAVGHLLVLPPNKTVALPEEAEPLTKGKESLEKTRHSPTCYGRQRAASERWIVHKRRERNVVGRYTRRVTSNVWTCAWLGPEENSWDKRSRLDQLESKRAGRSATILVGTCREHV